MKCASQFPVVRAVLLSFPFFTFKRTGTCPLLVPLGQYEIADATHPNEGRLADLTNAEAQRSHARRRLSCAAANAHAIAVATLAWLHERNLLHRDAVQTKTHCRDARHAHSTAGTAR